MTAGFAFKWNPIVGNTDWQLTQSKSYGDGIQTIGNALEQFGNATRKQNTDAMLLQIAQANSQPNLQNTGVLAAIDPMNRTIDNSGILAAYNARDNVLEKEAITDERDAFTSMVDLAKANNIDLTTAMTAMAPKVTQNTSDIYAGYTTGYRNQEAAKEMAERKLKVEEAEASQKLVQSAENHKIGIIEKEAALIEKARKDSVRTVVMLNPNTNQYEEVQVFDENAYKQAIAGLGNLGGGGNAPTAVAPRNISLSKEQTTNMDAAWGALQSAGVPANAATYLIGEMGREGSFLNSNISGHHTDANAGRTNSGIISYSDPTRRKNFLGAMEKQGFYKNGQLVHSPDAVQAQVNYVLNDMKANYPSAYQAMMSGNMTDETANRYFGDQFIGWDRANKGGQTSKGAQNRADFIGYANSRYGSGAQVGGGSAASGNTSNLPVLDANGRIDGVSTKGAKSSSKVMDTTGLMAIQTGMNDYRASVNAKNTLGANVGNTESDKAAYTALKAKMNSDSIFGTLRDGTDIHDKLVGNKDVWDKMSYKDRTEAYQYMMDKNKAHGGIGGINLTQTQVNQELRTWLSSREKERKMNEQQSELVKFHDLALGQLNKMKTLYPNLTLDDVMAAADGALYKRWKSYNVKNSKKYSTK